MRYHLDKENFIGYKNNVHMSDKLESELLSYFQNKENYSYDIIWNSGYDESDVYKAIHKLSREGFELTVCYEGRGNWSIERKSR